MSCRCCLEYLDEMDAEFGEYVERTIRRFNRTWAETDFLALAGDGGDVVAQNVHEIELDPLRTRKRIKTPLLMQDTGDIHRSSAKKGQSRALGACNRCMLRFPCIMVGLCVILGLFILAYLIFVIPSCGALLRNPKCILWRKKG